MIIYTRGGKMKGNILNFNNSEGWLLLKKYCTNNFINQINFFRYEDMHTNFLKSLFEPDNVYGLAVYPLKKIIELIKERFGVDIDIISGEEEATYDFDAIRYRFGKDVFPHGVVVDMGGGSTEMILFENERAVSLVSMQLGCVMLGKKFIPDIKKALFPCGEQSESIINYTEETLAQNISFRNKGESVYLIGGTGRAIAKLHAFIKNIDVKNFDGYTFSAEDISDIRKFAYDDIAGGAPVIRKILSDRLTTVFPGILAYEKIFSFLGTKRATVSACGVREGYLLDFISRNFSQKSQEF